VLRPGGKAGAQGVYLRHEIPLFGIGRMFFPDQKFNAGSQSNPGELFPSLCLPVRAVSPKKCSKPGR